MDQREFSQGLAEKIDQVFTHTRHPELYDHRKEYPWLTGSLGDPFSGIWFVGESPSLRMVERAKGPHNTPPNEEAQWSASRGDKLFRKALVASGFKGGSVDSPGGWHCYITNVIKEADYTNRVREKPLQSREQAADMWFPVFEWELEHSCPLLIVAMGRQASHLLKYLLKRLARPPQHIEMTHYAYVGQRARGHQGPMHPERVCEYYAEMGNIDRQFRNLTKGG